MITLIFPTNFVCVHMLTVMFYKHSTDNNIIEYITGEANNQKLKIMTRKLVDGAETTGRALSSSEQVTRKLSAPAAVSDDRVPARRQSRQCRSVRRARLRRCRRVRRAAVATRRCCPTSYFVAGVMFLLRGSSQTAETRLRLQQLGCDLSQAKTALFNIFSSR